MVCRASNAPARRLPQDLRLISVCKPHSASTNSSSVTTIIVHRILSRRISQSNRPLRPLRTRQKTRFSRSPPDTNLLDNALTRLLLLSPNHDQVEPLPSPDVPGNFLGPLYPSSALAISPSSSQSCSSCSLKTIRTTARCLAASNGHTLPVTKGSS